MHSHTKIRPNACCLLVTAIIVLDWGSFVLAAETSTPAEQPTSERDTIWARVHRESFPVESVRPVEISYPSRRHYEKLLSRGRQPASLDSITKASYLAFLKAEAPNYLRPKIDFMRTNDRYEATMTGFLAAYMYKHTREAMYGEAAQAMLESAIRYMKNPVKGIPHQVHTHYMMVDLMRETELVKPSDEPRLSEFLVSVSSRSCEGQYGWDERPWRRGAGHSSLGPAVARYYAVHRFKDVPDAARFKQYYEATWNDWWQYRDTIYNDTGYRALFLLHVFANAYLTDREDLFADAEAMKFWNRLLHTTAPCGAMPHMGDTNGWSTQLGQYLFVMEYLASKTRDGRFKWGAHRMFDYIVNHLVNIHDYHTETDYLLRGVAMAHMVADDTVKPVAPESESTVLTRKEIRYVAPGTGNGDLGWNVYNLFLGRRRNQGVLADMVLGPKDVPDKIVFKSSNEPGSFWAMINLSNQASHNDVPEVGNVDALMDHEAVLSCNQGYMDETPDLHNVVYAEDLEGRTRKAFKRMTIELDGFYDRTHAAYACIRAADYHSWPVDQQRQLLFVKDRLLVIKDVVTFTDTWKCRIGPCWQTQQVGPSVGKHWANTHVDFLFLSGLGQGLGIQRWKQPTRDLLVFHPPQTDCSFSMVVRHDLNEKDEQKQKETWWRVLPVRLQYTWQGTGHKGLQRHFTTLLLPHAPQQNASRLAGGIEVLADDLKLTALHVRLPDGRRDWIVLNDTGHRVTAGAIETDARQVHLVISTDKRHVMAEGGTFVNFNGKPIATGPAVDEAF